MLRDMQTVSAVASHTQCLLDCQTPMTKHTAEQLLRGMHLFLLFPLCAKNESGSSDDGTSKHALRRAGSQNTEQAGEFGVKSKSGRLKMKNGFYSKVVVSLFVTQSIIKQR